MQCAKYSVATISGFKQIVTTWLPPAAGVGLIALFVSLAGWQLERAAEKAALSASFEQGATPVALADSANPQLFQLVEVSGHYLPERQVLIDNIIRGGRVGYNIVTPFRAEPAGQVLLVNRGWIAKQANGHALPAIGVEANRRQLSARVGRLPRVALRPGPAFADAGDWPRVAVFPRLEDVAKATGYPLEAPVLLLAPGEDDGFVRDWQPEQKGPMMHYGYAFQWSAMALAVLVILVWQTRKHLRNEQ